MSLEIEYVSEDFLGDFPVGNPVKNGNGVLSTNWDELLWAAVTVGRPNRHYVFRHGNASRYEALFRWSLMRMALEQRGPSARRLRRTAAARTLDPSEKGAVNYFIGMALCKLFAAKCLDAPWAMHLDVFRPLLNPVLMGRSRPDLVAETRSNEWVALESKGRISPPSNDDKDKAKQQAERLLSVNRVVPRVHVGCITSLLKIMMQSEKESNLAAMSMLVSRVMPSGFTSMVPKPDIPTYFLGSEADFNNLLKMIPNPKAAYAYLEFPFLTDEISNNIKEEKDRRKAANKTLKG